MGFLIASSVVLQTRLGSQPVIRGPRLWTNRGYSWCGIKDARTHSCLELTLETLTETGIVEHQGGLPSEIHLLHCWTTTVFVCGVLTTVGLG